MIYINFSKIECVLWYFSAYSLTESDRFAPPRKKAKLLVNTYKLLSLNSTTPEELYARKIEMEEYGEALILAQHYNLVSSSSNKITLRKIRR